jgi:hypothetical protein
VLLGGRRQSVVWAQATDCVQVVSKRQACGGGSGCYIAAVDGRDSVVICWLCLLWAQAIINRDHKQHAALCSTAGSSHSNSKLRNALTIKAPTPPDSVLGDDWSTSYQNLKAWVPMEPQGRAALALTVQWVVACVAASQVRSCGQAARAAGADAGSTIPHGRATD